MAKKSKRVAGLQLDPEVSSWLETAAESKAALTKKQRQERQRARVKWDVPLKVKEAIAAEAAALETSESQFGAFLVAWAWKEYRRGNPELRAAAEKGLTHASALRFRYNLSIPGSWLEIDDDGDIDGDI